ncbi:MAG: carboxypeptidase regulatory-like domain-containing protein, partial [Novipirellula sp. JB048]
MPELYPATVTITQEGDGLADATVTLYPEDPALRRWAVGGVTDENGTATLRTHVKFPGAPAGRFKVMVNKTVTEGDP